MGFGTQDILALASEPSYFPYNVVFGRFVFCLPLGTSLGYLGCVQRGGDPYDDISGKQLGTEIGLHSDAVLYLGPPNLVDDGVDLEG